MTTKTGRSRTNGEEVGQHFDLTPREREVLELLSMGHTNKVIAARLSVTEDTAKRYVQNIIAKLHASDRTHAATIAAREGLLGGPLMGAWNDREIIQQLQARVAVLEQEVAALKPSLQEETIVLRTISREQAKQEVQELFGSGETLFYSDIAHRLQLELPLVVELCQELTAAGEIEVHDNAA